MESIVGDKSYKFAVRIVRLYQYLIKNHNEYVIGKQILRSGTSVGANIEEALGAISKKEFIAKVQISYKECRETRFWLRLLIDTEFIDKPLFESIMKDCEELIKLTTAILKSSKLNSE
ncbi:MAG TPA: four helix bundle protein [Bacteroidales bacterium]|nr:four helix bundle protein [Bacteroidales bacterium]